MSGKWRAVGYERESVQGWHNPSQNKWNEWIPALQTHIGYSLGHIRGDRMYEKVNRWCLGSRESAEWSTLSVKGGFFCHFKFSLHPALIKKASLAIPMREINSPSIIHHTMMYLEDDRAREIILRVKLIFLDELRVLSYGEEIVKRREVFWSEKKSYWPRTKTHR